MTWNQNSEWNSNRPIREWPAAIYEAFREHAEYLADELEHKRLNVSIIPAPNSRFMGHKVRLTESHNPDWYSKLYWNYPSIKRNRSTTILEHLIRGTDKVMASDNWYCPNRNHVVFRDLIFKRLAYGYDSDEGHVQPNEEVREYFKIED